LTSSLRVGFAYGRERPRNREEKTTVGGTDEGTKTALSRPKSG